MHSGMSLCLAVRRMAARLAGQQDGVDRGTLRDDCWLCRRRERVLLLSVRRRSVFLRGHDRLLLQEHYRSPARCRRSIKIVLRMVRSSEARSLGQVVALKGTAFRLQAVPRFSRMAQACGRIRWSRSEAARSTSSIWKPRWSWTISAALASGFKVA